MAPVRFESVDGGVVAYGATLGELFENAGYAVFSQLFELEGVPPTHSRPLVAPGDTVEELLTNWLHELLAMAEAEQLALSYFVVDRLEEGGVQGSAAGMPMRDVAGTGHTLAVGDGELELVEIPEGWWAAIPLRIEGPNLHLA